jgi:phage terminase large subunit-like protein
VAAGGTAAAVPGAGQRVGVDRRRLPPCGRTLDGVTCRRRGDHFCVPRADRAERFFAELLVHTKGPFARSPFVLAPWERDEVIRPLFGLVEWSPSWGRYVRRYRELYLSTARRNGKSELVAGILLLLLVGDDEEAAEIYGLALDKDQAAIIWDMAARMVALSPVLSARLQVIKTSRRIVDAQTASFYGVSAGDAEGSLGESPSAAVIDELLTQPSRDLYDAIHGGFGNRAQPLMILVTTADADPGGYAASEREWSERVQDDPALDRGRLVVLHAIPGDLDWADEANWPLANPALGDYLDPRVLRDERDKALRNPAAERAFRQYRCNQQVSRRGAAIDGAAWAASAGPVGWADLPALLDGMACYAGLDLASTSDLASYCLDFPRGEAGHAALWRVFAPESALPDLTRRTGGRAAVWADAGVLTVTEGTVIDYEAIKAALRADAERFDIRKIGFDRWGATQLSSELVDEGFPLVQVGQGFATMSAPTKELLRLIAAGRYAHGGNPVVTWQAENMITRTDPAGNVKPDKAASRDKIDSMVAAVMALDRALRAAAERGGDYQAAGF